MWISNNKRNQRDNQRHILKDTDLAIEAVIPGTQFVTFIRDVLPLRPEEKGLLWATLDEIKSVGGSIARGFGEVELSLIDEESTEEARTTYKKFIEENQDSIVEQLKKSLLKIE
jgi:CRISPR/Cas system CSM-associated protein Csm3 (group 7 of RAMP superfamily)